MMRLLMLRCPRAWWQRPLLLGWQPLSAVGNEHRRVTRHALATAALARRQSLCHLPPAADTTILAAPALPALEAAAAAAEAATHVAAAAAPGAALGSHTLVLGLLALHAPRLQLAQLRLRANGG